LAVAEAAPFPAGGLLVTPSAGPAGNSFGFEINGSAGVAVTVGAAVLGVSTFSVIDCGVVGAADAFAGVAVDCVAAADDSFGFTTEAAAAGDVLCASEAVFSRAVLDCLAGGGIGFAGSEFISCGFGRVISAVALLPVSGAGAAAV